MSTNGLVVSCSELAEGDVVSVLEVMVLPETLAGSPGWTKLRVADGGDVVVGDRVWWNGEEVWLFIERDGERVKRIYLRLEART